MFESHTSPDVNDPARLRYATDLAASKRALVVLANLQLRRLDLTPLNPRTGIDVLKRFLNGRKLKGKATDHNICPNCAQFRGEVKFLLERVAHLLQLSELARKILKERERVGEMDGESETDSGEGDEIPELAEESDDERESKKDKDEKVDLDEEENEQEQDSMDDEVKEKLSSIRRQFLERKQRAEFEDIAEARDDPEEFLAAVSGDIEQLKLQRDSVQREFNKHLEEVQKPRLDV